MRTHAEGSTLGREEFAPEFSSRRPLVPRRRRRRTLITLGLCLTLVAVAGGGFVLTQRGKITEVGLEDAVSQFREDRGQTSQAAAAEIAPPIVDVPAQSAPQAAPAGDGPLADPEEELLLQTPQRYARPAEGVYAYRATGGERISLLGATHDYPERVYATVRHLEDCRWQMRNDVLREHVDVVELCSREGVLEEVAQGRTIEFFGKKDGDHSHCDPPLVLHALGEEPGAVSTARCEGKGGGRSELTRTFIGQEDVAIGEELVRAVSFRIDGSFTGSATGTSVDEFWVAADTGLVLRWKRSVDSTASSFGAKVRYTEEATFELESVRPHA